MLGVFVQPMQNFYRMITVHSDAGVPGKMPLWGQRQHGVVPCGTDGRLSSTLLKSVSSNTRMLVTATTMA
jgi:hypothetical protein